GGDRPGRSVRPSAWYARWSFAIAPLSVVFGPDLSPHGFHRGCTPASPSPATKEGPWTRSAGGGPVGEPKMVVARREQLWWLLAEAAQLEHMIMCEYLYAEFSLKDGSGDGLTAGQAEAVGRWRTTLREIAMEEMLHLALVSNLMTAIGAAPVFGRP